MDVEMISCSNSSPSSDVAHNDEPVGEDATHDEIQVALTQTNNLGIVPQGSTSEGGTTENIEEQDRSGRTDNRTTIHIGNGEIRIAIPDDGAVEVVRIVTRDESMMKMIKIFVKVLGQAVAGIIANASIKSSSTPPWAIYVLVFATLLALICTFTSIYLSGTTTREALSVWMFKIGAIATAFVIILSLGLQLPSMVASIACPIAFVMAAAVVFASS